MSRLSAFVLAAISHQGAKAPKKFRGPDAAHYGAIADAARQQAVATSWERPMRAATRRKTSSAAVKLHPGWDAAFKRARAS